MRQHVGDPAQAAAVAVREHLERGVVVAETLAADGIGQPPGVLADIVDPNVVVNRAAEVREDLLVAYLVRVVIVALKNSA